MEAAHPSPLVALVGNPNCGKTALFNVLTGSHTDPVTHTPAYKETAVKLQVLSESGENPIPRTNSRFGHPTPQPGVEVERKWKRRDYKMPGDGLVNIRTK